VRLVKPTLPIFFGTLVTLLVSIFPASPACGRDLVVRRTIEGYSLTTSITRNPPVLGKNGIRVEIKDAQGKPASNASVSINYYMPPMPGMAPMNYTIPAPLSGSAYTATMDLIMRGPWNIVVRAAVPGKTLRMTVAIDVR
jgi:hypothetical protein